MSKHTEEVLTLIFASLACGINVCWLVWTWRRKR